MKPQQFDSLDRLRQQRQKCTTPPRYGPETALLPESLLEGDRVFNSALQQEQRTEGGPALQPQRVRKHPRQPPSRHLTVPGLAVQQHSWVNRLDQIIDLSVGRRSVCLAGDFRRLCISRAFVVIDPH